MTLFEPEHQDDGAPQIAREPGDAAYVVALSRLPGMGPATLRQLLAARPASTCWREIAEGRLDRTTVSARAHALHEQWRVATGAIDPIPQLEDVIADGIGVHILGDASYPAMLTSEPTAPATCFTIGAPATDGSGRTNNTARDTPRVAIVGTRSSTHYGEEVAAELGSELAAAGVVVVSGLAAGIDAAAHEGALTRAHLAAPIAYVGGGVDVVYPASNRRLRERLAASGTLISEAPPGAPPERWRFPLRNRLVASTVDLVIVVEAHRSGGAMHTVEAAVARGVAIAAVPGSVRSRASDGTNALIADGAAMVRDVDDAIALVELTRAGRPWPTSPGRGPTGALASDTEAPQTPDVPQTYRAHGATVNAGPRGVLRSGSSAGPEPRNLTPDAMRVLAALGHETTSLEVVVRRSSLTVGAVAIALEELLTSKRALLVPGGYMRGADR